MPKKPNYKVGRGKPPRETQFKRGRSGNSAGRPKGSPNVNKVIKKVLMRKINLTEGGRRKAMTKLEAMTTQLVNKAAQGDTRSIEQALKRAEAIDNQLDAQSSPARAVSEDDQKVIEHVLERMRRVLQGDGAKPTPAVPDVQSQTGGDHDSHEPK